jgi:Aromatic-ring-opening dioxygenase LigAB, LigA subunit
MNGKSGLASFLHKLSEDKELQQAYTSDPRGTMQQAGLSDEEVNAMMSRDLGRIKAMLAREGGPEATLLMVLTESGG